MHYFEKKIDVVIALNGASYRKTTEITQRILDFWYCYPLSILIILHFMSAPATTLDQLIPNIEATVTGYLDDTIKEKMLEMGCLPGAKVSLNRTAPLGDPIIIEIDDAKLALRKEEAKFISIEINS